MRVTRRPPQPRRVVSWVVVAGLVGSLAWAATQAEGFVTPEPELHDAGVWVTRSDERRLGRTNTEIQTVDTSLSMVSASFDVLQADATVYVRQHEPSQLLAVDPVRASVIPGPELPNGVELEVRGGTAAVLDPTTGTLIVTGELDLLGVDLDDEEARTHAFDAEVAVAVGVDGHVHAIESGTGLVLTFNAAGEFVEERELVGLADEPGQLQVAAIGSRPVVLAAESGRLHLGDDVGAVDLSSFGSLPVLQRSGERTGHVAIMTDESLLSVGLRDGEVEVVVDGGVGMPAVPVVVHDCAYAAWNGNGLVGRACADGTVGQRTFPEIAGGSALTWRVNRQRVVLNELESGRQVIYGEGDPVYLDDWAEALDDQPDEPGEADDTAPEATPQERDRSQNEPPVANDTVAGTRQGRPVVVHPLRNDVDPDGDVLVISPLEPLDLDIGRATVVDDGQAVLVELASDRAAPVSFPYEITDGFGHSARATITVNVVPEDVNHPPEPLQGDRTTVVTGGTVVHDVLAGAIDPDGDPVSLVSATTDAGDVRFESNGRITFTATNEPGDVDVVYVLADDRGAEASGLLRVTVVPSEVNEPPVARNDHAETVVGREVVVDVLANDTDANGDPLSLVRVENLSSGTLRWDPSSPEVRFQADRPGTYNAIYRITDGRDTAEALLRIDVIEPDAGGRPTAVRDDVLLMPGLPAYVDVLANDVDPDGDVLVVTGVSLPADVPFDVQILHRSVLRIEADAPLAEVVEFDYHVTDGTHHVTGRVVVAPAPERERTQPPVVGPDEFTVRAGGIAVLPVLANDYDPDGGSVELVEPEPVDDETAAREGRLFLSDGELRYEAPLSPRSTVATSTTVVDSADNTASGQLLINVIEPTGERNNPPVAPTLVGRVLAGERVTIPVPLATMDPEGDVVTLVGLDSPPSLGAVVEVAASELVYHADVGASGTDEFTYRVKDQFGLEATGTVLVGVVGESPVNNDPVAVDDDVNVVPGTSVVVPALANDHDPDGDPISYSTAADDVPVAAVGTVELVDGELRYDAPDTAEVGTQTSFVYAITDGRGGRDTATVTIHVVEEIPNRPPEPMDVIVEPQLPGAEFRTAPLHDNDHDPDGDELYVVSVSHPDVVLHEDGSVSMTMPDHAVQFTYVVSDGIDERRAAVIVPLAENRPPVTSLARARVEMGEQVVVDVLDHAYDPEGDDLVLLDVLGVRHGTAEVRGDQVVFTASEENYVGSAGFVYLVADSDDPSVALSSLGVVQIMITGNVNTPPRFTQLRVEVPQDGERTLDLAGAVVDPDPGQTHTFGDLRGAGDGVSADLDGSTLTVRASRDAQPGTFVTLNVTVDDGFDDVEGTIDVTVTSSDRPLARAVPDLARTVQGEAVTIRVLDNDVNPFPDTPLRVIDVTQPPGATVTTDGTLVEVRPDPERRDLGEVTFSYTVADGTDDPSRHVTGTVTVTVVGRPDIPAAPSCIGGESSSVQIGWAAPSANGARITEYVVRISEYQSSRGEPRTSTRRFSGGSTVQTIDALTNGREHTFEVAAVNEAVIGEPEFSAPSPRCMPDQVPDRPEPPAAAFGDGELRLTFAAPPVDGTPIRSLTLRNTTTGEEQVLGPRETSYTWTGLENGTSYRFTLVATNDRGDSDPSELSTGDGIPAGVPLNAVAPTTEKGDRFLTVMWQRPEENGDAIVEYRITIIRAGVEQGQVPIPDAARRSVQIDTDNAVEYEFQLEARNKAGWSQRSPRSAPAISAGRPFPITSVTATEGDRETTLSFDAPNDNGAAITRYEVSTNGGSWTELRSDRRVRNLTNGTNYSFRVRAVNAEGAGDASPPSNTINPYGRPTTPGNLRSSHDGSRRITWNWNASDGNGRSIDRYEVRLNSGSWQSVGTSRSFSHTVSTAGDSATLRVRAVSTASDSSRRVSGEAGPQTQATPRRTHSDTVADAFLLGTCSRASTAGGSWLDQAECQAAGGTWHTNGTSLTLDCKRTGGAYTVQFVGGRTETWDLHVRIRNTDRWVRWAAMNSSTSNSMNALDTC